MRKNPCVPNVRRIPWTLLAAGAAAASSAALAQSRSPELDAHLTLANDYRSRGLSQVASGAAWQLGVDYEHASGFFVGGVLANVDYSVESAFADARRHSVELYAGYAWDSGNWNFNVAAGRYMYPGVVAGYDYGEIGFAAALANRFFYRASYADSAYALPYSAWHHEVGIAQPLRWDVELSAAAGEYRSDLVAGGSYSHWNVGISKIVRRVGVDLRYHGASLEGPSYIGNAGAERWVLSVSYGFPGNLR